MIPIVTPEEMGAIDRAAPEPVDLLIDRAGSEVARMAITMLGGTYGRRVVVVAGKGNNGNDGRSAAAKLRRRGVRVRVIDAAGTQSDTILPRCDLVIDAAYGTGFSGTYHAPSPADDTTPVLAVDIASGVDGLTGVAGGRPLAATRTVTFAALKPGLLLADGADVAGAVSVVDIGLDVSCARAHLVTAADVASWLPRRPRSGHKWQNAVWLVAGSPGMTGAAHLATRAAQRAGAGYVRLSSPGLGPDPFAPMEAVGVVLPDTGWDADVLEGQDRFGALAVGPGLGTDDRCAEAVRRLVTATTRPLVVDGDGLSALAAARGGAAAVCAGRSPGAEPVILTPHDGEFERLTGHPPRPDRFNDVRVLAAETGAVVLLKGSTTVVADPAGAVLVSNTGDARLASAGTGDVLTGTIAAFLAQGLSPLRAAAAGAFVHGRAGHLSWPRGLVAGDVAAHLPAALAELGGVNAPQHQSGRRDDHRGAALRPFRQRAGRHAQSGGARGRRRSGARR